MQETMFDAPNVAVSSRSLDSVFGRSMMIRRHGWPYLVQMVCAVVLATGCGSDIALLDPPVRTDISAAQLQEMIDDGAPIILIDVRSAGEYAGGHIAGAINVPLGTVQQWASTQSRLDRIVCICWSGGRSRAAADDLVELGFRDVYNLLGGVSNWPGDLVTG
jgi:rhodanese-related sulfurtransferase